jgi:hypothetical protein
MLRLTITSAALTVVRANIKKNRLYWTNHFGQLLASVGATSADPPLEVTGASCAVML